MRYNGDKALPLYLSTFALYARTLPLPSGILPNGFTFIFIVYLLGILVKRGDVFPWILFFRFVEKRVAPHIKW